MNYDYSGIPVFTATWYLTEEKDHWIDLKVSESGLVYIGTDYSCASGGGYMAGFQTFEEFFSHGPLNRMPKEIRKNLREHLETHRREGGTVLLLSHVNNLPGLVLWRAFVHLDDNPIKIAAIDGTVQETVFYDGFITAGKHTIGFVLVFKQKDKTGEKDPLWKTRGDFTFRIQRRKKGKKDIRLTTFLEKNGNDICTTCATQG